MAHSLISQIAILALLGTLVFAFAKGGSAERWGAALICISWLGGDAVSFLLRTVFSKQYLELTLLFMDAGLAVGLLILALRFAKMWLGLAMFMQSGELALHGIAIADWGLSFKSYALFNNLISFSLLTTLAVATSIRWFDRSRTARRLLSANEFHFDAASTRS
jgi:hypothetical protein